ncbi:MAG TPA: T9SS type A sorting domain-containing protein [Bacteroidota bacterium]|nr:T9SS type A sorting domain-containing protein [Bacteroidota bacterium]
MNERKNAGSYEEKIDGSNLASGVYFYRLQTGDFIQTRKLLLTK